MGRVRASIDVPGLASEAEALWYDTSRWPTFIDGLHHVARLEGDWPHPGARVLWDSNPGGRGRVQERVTEYAAREGQTLAVEDEKLHGTQRVTFTPTASGVTVALELHYQLKDTKPAMALVDLLFIRRPQREALQRTLRRFRTEVAAEREGSV
ncbi:MAG TPA: SRPBCC family protein [Solirubrobacteraceae bacterium]